MAINMNDKMSLLTQIIPEVEFNFTTNGITLTSERISTPRFIPFENGGRCRECKSTEVELDFIVTKEGVTIYCTRFSAPRFVPFDCIYDLPGHCFFKIKNKGRVLNIPYGSQSVCPVTNFRKREAEAQLLPPPPPPPPLPPQNELLTPPPVSPPIAPQPELHTPPLASPEKEITSQEPLIALSPIKEEPKENEDAVLLEFFDSMQAVTMGIMPTQSEVKNEVVNNPSDTNLQPPL
uniref:Uncharacterized protein n=2 Tax=Meloidogyne TaxID=189290 RepID=A0A6V7Y2L0_MELEN|nr:unnamed protein product [Meloidogyne enterolobii]CAD2205853.1 unnamed protein product [Meloidogyne enterolobii]